MSALAVAASSYSFHAAPFVVIDLTDPKADVLAINPDHIAGPLALSPDSRFVALAGHVTSLSTAQTSPDNLGRRDRRKVAEFSLAAKRASASVSLLTVTCLRSLSTVRLLSWMQRRGR